MHRLVDGHGLGLGKGYEAALRSISFWMFDIFHNKMFLKTFS